MRVTGNGRVALTILGALLVVFVALTYSGYRRDLGAARVRVSSGSQVVNTACGSIEYADVGQGPPVLVVHGAGGGFDQGLEVAQPLIDRGLRVIAVSRFGYLRTPLPADASPIAQANAHACLLDVLKLERVAVIGGSAGAPSAMQLCLRHPERCTALVLLFPLAFAPGRAELSRAPDSVRLAGQPSLLFTLMIKTTLHSDFLFWAATKLARNTLVKTVLGTPVEDFRTAPREEQVRALQIMRNILPVSQRERGIWNDATIGPSLPRYDLERIRVPTLLISAEDDLYGTFLSARYTAEHIPGARFVGYPTGGHLLLGHWKEAGAEVAGFLSGQSPEEHSITK
ncbi:MAG: alpha/beta hydrolase [Acidobacteriia bacterium]|nr:alpha/beta hydrolase [Terriglobia bacterium]